MNAMIEKQQQMVMKYLEGIIRERALTSKEDDGSVSRDKRNIMLGIVVKLKNKRS